MQKWVTAAFAILVLAHVVGLVIMGRLTMDAAFEVRHVAADNRDFVVRKGATLTEVLDELHTRELAPNALSMLIVKQVKRRDFVVKQGTYRFPQRISTWDILEMLHRGDVVQVKLTIPEGLDKWETAQLLGLSRWGEEGEFQALIDDPRWIHDFDPGARDLEGFLFPETYQFPLDATAEDVVKRMVDEFKLQAESMAPLLAESDLSVRDWVTLASLVEKESALASERSTISGVFHRRLDKGMLLQCDPTIIYALKLDELYRGKIYRSQIDHDHPYNTYVYRGLPPGPIASPGRGSLHAALVPKPSEYLYFVSKNDGSHVFSRTLKEHNRAVQRYQR